jgi:hypothetical protein
VRLYLAFTFYDVGHGGLIPAKRCGKASLTFPGPFQPLPDPIGDHRRSIAQFATQYRCDYRILRLLVGCDYRNMAGMNNAALNVIRKCGGPKATALMAGVDVSNVHRWTYPKERGGTGGVIPARHQRRLLEKAKEQKIPLKPDDFFADDETDTPGSEAA